MSAARPQRITHEGFNARFLECLRHQVLVRRLLVGEALGHWPGYVVAFALMAVAATGTALSAYLLGTMTNEAYVHRHFQGILAIGIITIAIFAAKGLATYGSSVMLSAVSNRIVADNQQRIFDKLLQEDMAYFADRHSSEFIARLTTGATAVSGVIALMITAEDGAQMNKPIVQLLSFVL
jgi:subfamily B ATP-binding cassette protein MsbA